MFMNISDAKLGLIYSIILNLLMYFCIYDGFMSAIFLYLPKYYIGSGASLAILRPEVHKLSIIGNSRMNERNGQAPGRSDQAHRLEKK